jgi:hypothetical protein
MAYHGYANRYSQSKWLDLEPIRHLTRLCAKASATVNHDAIVKDEAVSGVEMPASAPGPVEAVPVLEQQGQGAEAAVPVATSTPPAQSCTAALEPQPQIRTESSVLLSAPATEHHTCA